MISPKYWTFDVCLSGQGETEEEAWQNVVAALAAGIVTLSAASTPKPEGPPNEVFNSMTAPQAVLDKCVRNMSDATGVIIPETERLLKALRRIVKIYHAEYGGMEQLPISPTHWSAADRMAVTAALALNCNQEV
jgi:predicted RNase H-like HicB family nuclease